MGQMKDSGIEWIGEIPAEWEVRKIKHMYVQRVEKVSDKEYAPLSVTMKGILPQLSTAAKTDDGDNRKLVNVGDFAINSRSDRRGSCGISRYCGSVSLINIVLKSYVDINMCFYDWLFHSVLFSDEFYRWGHGIVDDLWTTNWQDMKNINVPLPSLPEQQRIADYLDAKCGEIDKVMSKTRESIAEYKKLKQSIITEAVTKGVDGERPMKDSGIEWIGQIPAEWEVRRIKDSFGFGKGLSITKENLIESGIPVISYGQIHSKGNSGVCVKDSLVKYVDSAYLETDAHSLVNLGDFIFADTSEDIEGTGNSVFVDVDKELFAGYHTVVLKNKGCSNKYFAYLFQSDGWRAQLRSKVYGIKVFSITKKILGNANIVYPPLTEQQRIVAYLDEKCSEIDNLIARKEQLLTELEKYKKSLIYECVTGKREVG